MEGDTTICVLAMLTRSLKKQCCLKEYSTQKSKQQPPGSSLYLVPLPFACGVDPARISL